jgi:hypothetical protein
MRLLLPLLLAAVVAVETRALPVQELRSIGGLPPHLAGSFEEITACHLTPDGQYLVFDRRQHAVFAATADSAAPKKIVDIGPEPGRLYRPLAFDSAADGTAVVADAPGKTIRIQFFVYSGGAMGGFMLPGEEAGPQLRFGDMVLSGVASIQYTGSTILLNRPEMGALVTEYGTDGTTLRSFGHLRPTGHEKDIQVHRALNAGLPLVNPRGGYYFVFLAGTPMFRKYDAKGVLVFERHIEGLELDPLIRDLPTTWTPRVGTRNDELPLMSPAIRAAAVDRNGELWISLAVPYTYVYDTAGEKRRTVQFRAAGITSPSSFFFTKDNRVLVTPGCYAFSAKG